MDTFDVDYLLTLQSGETIDQKLRGICLEQSVELSGNLISDEIEKRIVGQILRREPMGDQKFNATIRWPVDDIGTGITQFLNLLYGNISLKPGIQITGIDWNALPDTLFRGPAYGIHEIRDKYEIPKRALSCTALKPMGYSARELADLAYEFALGGLDIIKEDHGLSNQPYAPFDERVKACIEAIRRAADETGHRSYYYPNVTGDFLQVKKRYLQAAEWGADGVLLSPHLSGLSVMHHLARLDVDLPIMAHPAFSGSLITQKDQGFSHALLYGGLWRALGADFVIYPNTGGRFSFTAKDCRSINEAARDTNLNYAQSFPTIAGGMKRSTITKWLDTYGPDTVFLIGGDLYEHPDGVRYAAEEFQAKLEDY